VGICYVLCSYALVALSKPKQSEGTPTAHVNGNPLSLTTDGSPPTS